MEQSQRMENTMVLSCINDRQKKLSSLAGFALALFLCISLSACATTRSENNIQKANAHVQLGMSYMNDNNIQPAFVEFQKALEYNPNDKEAHNAIGVIYLKKLGDNENAIKHFKAALKIDASYAEAANNLGSAYADMGNYDKAIESYKLALSNPQYRNAAMALNNLGMVYYRLSRYEDALTAYKESLKRFSDFYMPFYGLALCYNAKGLYGDAAQALTRAIELDPLYGGNKEKFSKEMEEKRLRAQAHEQKDIADYLDIMKY
jgi:type IV pilus biogenesis/stability protein PilW